MTLLPCAGVLCPLLSDPLIWQLHGVLKHLAQQMMLNNCRYKHITKNLKSHTENAKIANHAGKKKKYSTEANTLTTSRQNLLSDMYGRPEFSQSALPTRRKLWENKLLATCLSGQILPISNQAGLSRAYCWGSALPAGQGALRFKLYHFHLREVCLLSCSVKWEHRTAADSQTGTVFFMLTGLE